MPMSLPRGAIPANTPRDVHLQIVTPCKRPPSGDGWLHEVKHDGHRLVAILPGDGQLMLLSRNGYDRTKLFREPFRRLLDLGLPPMVLDVEIAVPDDRGVTHLDALSDAISDRRSERLAYFAFDLLHLDGHDLRRCPIEDRKMLLRDVIGAASCERIVNVDHVLGIGKELFEAVRQIGGEGIVSKRRGSQYRGGESREWLKTKCSETGVFEITGFSELGDGKLDAVYVAFADTQDVINIDDPLAPGATNHVPQQHLAVFDGAAPGTSAVPGLRRTALSRCGSGWLPTSSSSAGIRAARSATA